MGETSAPRPRLRHTPGSTGMAPVPRRAPNAGAALRRFPLAAVLALAVAAASFAGPPGNAGPAGAPRTGNVVTQQAVGGVPFPPAADAGRPWGSGTAEAVAVPAAAVLTRGAAPVALPQQDPVRAKYQTTEATTLYASATSKRKRASIPADYTLASPTNKISSDGTRVQVRYRSKTGWVLLSKTTEVPLSTKVGKLSWKASAAKNVAAWCKGVSIRTNIVGDNSAHVDWSQNGPERKKASEWINLATVAGRNKPLDPNHPMAVAVQYHECAHILQYRAYGYDGDALKEAMNRVYGKGNGVEHMADCMADAMGAQRTGTEYLANGSTRMWVAGYGGSCTRGQLAAARKLIAGEKV